MNVGCFFSVAAFIVSIIVILNSGESFLTALGYAAVFAVVGFLGGLILTFRGKNLQCNNCDYLGKGSEWNDNDNKCPNCGSKSYKVLE